MSDIRRQDQFGERRYLFLQGPVGSFFNVLASRLSSKGYAVRKVHFNWGDRFFWLGCPVKAHSFHDTAEKWPQWFKSYIADFKPTDLVLYGDCRNLHRQAIKIANNKGIRVHVFEEGYIRPHMVTLEEGGVNGFSPMLADKKKTRKAIEALPEDTGKSYASSLGAVMRPQFGLTFLYYTCIMFGGLFAEQHNHRSFPPVAEAYLWTKRYLTNPFRKRRTRETAVRFFEDKKPYFVFMLQLSDDYQIRVHSHFRSTAQSIKHVIKSFSRHAKKEDFLIIKNHPLDNGKNNYQKIIYEEALKNKIKDRVVYVDGGSLILLLDHAKGAISVNSTAGLQAIHRGLPTKTLAPAFYNFKGLVDQGSLDNFWRKPQPPNPDFYRQFRHYLVNTNQISGHYYSRRGLQQLVPRAVKALTEV